MDDLKSVRLEVLKLAHRHDLASEQVVARAKDFEAYIVGADNRGTLTLPRPAGGGKDHKSGPGR